MTLFALILVKPIIRGSEGVCDLEVLSVTPGLSMPEALGRLSDRPRGTAAIVRRAHARLPKVGEVIEGAPPSMLQQAQARAQENRREKRRAWARAHSAA